MEASNTTGAQPTYDKNTGAPPAYDPNEAAIGTPFQPAPQAMFPSQGQVNPGMMQPGYGPPPGYDPAYGPSPSNFYGGQAQPMQQPVAPMMYGPNPAINAMINDPFNAGGDPAKLFLGQRDPIRLNCYK